MLKHSYQIYFKYDAYHINGIIDLTDKGIGVDSSSYNGAYGLDGETIT